MKRKIFMACAALVVSAAAVVGVKAYNYYSMPELMRANLEALTQDEEADVVYCYDEIVNVDGMYVVYCPICPKTVPGRAALFTPKKECK